MSSLCCIAYMIAIFIHVHVPQTLICPLWGAVAQWLERATDDRVVAGSNPAEAVWKLWQFPLPHFASAFQKKH